LKNRERNATDFLDNVVDNVSLLDFVRLEEGLGFGLGSKGRNPLFDGFEKVYLIDS
jgi:hypothetical protein